MIVDRDGNSWERCSECGARIPYPRSTCDSCEAEFTRAIRHAETAQSDERDTPQ